MTMLKTVATCAGLLALLRAQPIQAACATAPQLLGEPALVAAVTEELTRRGSAGLGTDCSPLRVQVSSVDGQYLVGIEDSFARRSQRQVASVEMVATLIETWMEPGVETPLFPPAAPSPVLVAAPAAEPAPSRVVLSAQVESALANDNSLWMGLATMACLRTGRFCPGLLLRLAGDEGWTGDHADRQESRGSLAAMLAASARFSFGRARLLPRLGVAAAWTWGGQPRARHNDGPPSADNRGRLRSEVGITGQLMVRQQWALSLDLSCELAPLALQTRISDPRALHEPWIFTRLGLGVSWGTP